ncbi:MAG: hypothetical protein PVG98_14775, partial [Chromatiales bacterium]
MMRFPMGPAVALLIALAPVAGPAAGERAAEYDRVSLSASASAQVENDTLVAVLYEQREGDDPAMLAGQVNRSIGRAVARVKQVEDVEVQTL